MAPGLLPQPCSVPASPPAPAHRGAAHPAAPIQPILGLPVIGRIFPEELAELVVMNGAK